MAEASVTMTKERKRESPFSMGLVNFNLRILSDELRSEIQRRLSDLPMEYHLVDCLDPDGEKREHIAWSLIGEASPRYSQSAFRVVGHDGR
jgi:hypothetical protein